MPPFGIRHGEWLDKLYIEDDIKDRYGRLRGTRGEKKSKAKTESSSVHMYTISNSEV